VRISRRVRLVAVVAAASLALVSAETALASVPITNVSGREVSFHTPDGKISCMAVDGAHGSGVLCQRKAGGVQLEIAWFGTYRYAHVSFFLAPGRTIAFGTSRGFAFPGSDHHQYDCKASHGAMRCFDVKTKHGFLLGLRVAKIF
jgi:hypothetical protein